MKGWAVALALWALAAVALVVAHANRELGDDDAIETGYPGSADAFDYLTSGNPYLWLGIAIGLGGGGAPSGPIRATRPIGASGSTTTTTRR